MFTSSDLLDSNPGNYANKALSFDIMILQNVGHATKFGLFEKGRCKIIVLGNGVH